MKRLVYFAFMITMLLSATGCTQNDGRIGPVFGIWQLESIENSDGNPLPDDISVPENMVWMFQNDVVCMRRMGVAGTYTSYWGTFRLCATSEERHLILDYNHSDNETPAGTDLYSLPDGIGLPHAPATLRFVVKHIDDSRMVIALPSSTDATPVSNYIVYSFKKIP